MSEETQCGGTGDPQPAAMSLSEQYDAILERLLEIDPTARLIRRRIAAIDAKIDEMKHHRHLQVVMMTSHAARLKRKATEELQILTGTRSLPGFGAMRETRAQFRVRMEAARAAAEKEARDKLKDETNQQTGDSRSHVG